MRSTQRWIAALLLAPVVLLSVAYLATKTDRFRHWVMAKERRLALLGDPEIEALPSMVWAHRGLRGPSAPPNTREAMLAAADAGYLGVELDLRWRDGALVVAHDADELGQPFSAVVSGVSSGQYLWLDFKQLSASLARECAQALRRQLPVSLRTRTFIESSSLQGLAVLRAALPGTRSIYTTRRWHWPRFSLGYVSLLHDIEQHEISILGLPAATLSPEVARALDGIGLFTWTTNDAGKLKQQQALGVDVILTDRLPTPNGPAGAHNGRRSETKEL
jgi:glycerophosphoryl diester phosphodiesterase